MPIKVTSTQDSIKSVRFTYEQGTLTSRPASPRSPRSPPSPSPIFTPNSTFTQLSMHDPAERSHHFPTDSYLGNNHSLTVIPCERLRNYQTELPIHPEIIYP